MLQDNLLNATKIVRDQMMRYLLSMNLYGNRLIAETIVNFIWIKFNRYIIIIDGYCSRLGGYLIISLRNCVCVALIKEGSLQLQGPLLYFHKKMFDLALPFLLQPQILVTSNQPVGVWFKVESDLELI